MMHTVIGRFVTGCPPKCFLDTGTVPGVQEVCRKTAYLFIHPDRGVLWGVAGARCSGILGRLHARPIVRPPGPTDAHVHSAWQRTASPKPGTDRPDGSAEDQAGHGSAPEPGTGASGT